MSTSIDGRSKEKVFFDRLTNGFSGFGRGVDAAAGAAAELVFGALAIFDWRN